uniref:Uncharacterized protein n=1 Tax=Leersia perrieri TaxID=77586 RepID=A0A0D9WJZ5_9ORYZ
MELKEEKKAVVRRRAWDCGSPLYDSYELASVYGLLDSNLMVLPFGKRSPARRTPAAKTMANEQRRRKAAATKNNKGKSVLRSIFRSVTCSRKL